MTRHNHDTHDEGSVFPTFASRKGKPIFLCRVKGSNKTKKSLFKGNRGKFRFACSGCFLTVLAINHYSDSEIEVTRFVTIHLASSARHSYSRSTGMVGGGGCMARHIRKAEWQPFKLPPFASPRPLTNAEFKIAPICLLSSLRVRLAACPQLLADWQLARNCAVMESARHGPLCRRVFS